jgi:ABC-type uncharacterized transport system substrate-binding protein
VKRREFITLLGGAAAGWPIAARSQTGERTRRIGVLMNLPSDDPEGMARLAAFLQGLQELGWTVGRNVRIDYRWGVPDADRIRKHAAELEALTPDVILSSGTPSVGASQQASRTVPIVFAQVPDPVGAGFVESLARPGGNITGFGGLNIVPAGNGWSCSKRSHRTSRRRRSCGTPRKDSGQASWPRYKPWPLHLEWS